MRDVIIRFYQEQIRYAETRFQTFDKRSNTYSFLRLFCLVAGIFLIYKTLSFENVLLTETLFLTMVILFAWLVSRQASYDKKKRYYTDLRTVAQNEYDCIKRRENLYDSGEQWQDARHIYTSDLDIFGPSSLFHLINRCATSKGNQILATYLMEKAENEQIRERQELLKELAGKPHWLLDFKALLLFARKGNYTSLQPVLAYLKASPTQFKVWLQLYIRYIPWVLLALGLTSFFVSNALIPLVVAGLLNITICQLNYTKVNKADLLLGKAGKALSNYSAVFRSLEEEVFSSTLSRHLVDEINGAGSLPFSTRIKQLAALLSRLEYRLNFFIGPLLNFFMAWDIRQLIAIEHWKKENADQISIAFESLAQFEALVSLGTLHYNNPDWTFPEIAEGQGYTFVATTIGHPLIPVTERVNNDFRLDDTYHIDIITGSNMAGKSTFLRTIGINAVLALSGAPVSASYLKISNMHVFTYMRIKDSLDEHTSSFKAELDRLRLLFDTLQRETKVYFLIDEMLRGTNSVDKYLGSKGVIEKLISQKAVGIVATHDLQIARLEDDYPQYIRNFYFDIQLAGEEMHFDYKLKHGECKTFNAATLLRQLGIKV